ncbi:MAG: AAA family ATPase, partial [Solirubrobacteraceae bacterium]
MQLAVQDQPAEDPSGAPDAAGLARIAFRHTPPRARPAVQRPELFDRLDRGVEEPLTLITGPAGAGKTVLLTSWLAARRPPGPVAWLSLERPDGRLARFWSEVLKLIREATGAHAAHLPDPAQIGQRDFVSALGQALEHLPERVVIVLDDFEQLHSQPVTEDLDRLLRSPQRGLRIVIASRRDPGLPLQRLRLEGRLTELRAGDLALTFAQAVELFAMSGLDLPVDHVRRLCERTEGWAAGLSLAALSLRGHPDPHAFVSTFAGDERTVADYLVEEVLHQQPADMREFMLRTSVVDELEPDLADALTGRTDSARFLEILERSNAFLLPVDERRRRYRYHPMFKELLRNQLRYRMRDTFALEHRRAAHWFARSGPAATAVQHAMAAGDLKLATDLLCDHWLALVTQGDTHSLVTWIDGLPRRNVAGNPELAVAAAGAALDLGHRDQALGFLALADAGTGLVPGKRRARFGLSRAVVKMMQARIDGDFEETRTGAHKVLAGQQMTDAAVDLRAVAGLHHGIAEWWLGASDAGLERLKEALELARRDGCAYIALACLGHLALFEVLEGRLREAESDGRRAAGLAARDGWDEQPVSAPGYLALAYVAYHRAQPQHAREELRRATAAAGFSQDPTMRCLIDLIRSGVLAPEEPAAALRAARSVHDEVRRHG